MVDWRIRRCRACTVTTPKAHGFSRWAIILALLTRKGLARKSASPEIVDQCRCFRRFWSWLTAIIPCALLDQARFAYPVARLAPKMQAFNASIGPHVFIAQKERRMIQLFVAALFILQAAPERRHAAGQRHHRLP